MNNRKHFIKTQMAENNLDFNDNVTPTPHPADPELYEILQNEIFGEVFSTGVLTDVERELLTVTALAAMQTLPQLKAHVAAALRTGASPLQVRETIYQCAPYIGFPKTLTTQIGRASCRERV